MTAIRLAIDSASSWSWVTITKVDADGLWRRVSSSCICSLSLASSADNGSSSSKHLRALDQSARSATRWRCRPDN
jgi:hypothetical protein